MAASGIVAASGKFARPSAVSLKMVWRPLRALVVLALVGYFISKIIVAYIKLKEEKIGTAFNTINADTVEVG